MNFSTPTSTLRPDLLPAVATRTPAQTPAAGTTALTAGTATPGAGMGAGRNLPFNELLNRKVKEVGTPESRAHARAEKVAGDLVANALILPVLKQVRRSTFGENSVFSGGTGEKTFGPQFDMEIADRIAHSPRMAVTQSLATRLERKGAAAKATPAVNPKPLQQKKLDLHG